MMRHFFTILCFLLIAQAVQAQGTTRRVKPNNIYQPGPGSDWVNAYSDVQAAINASNPGDEVWIAAGTYKLNPGQSFNLKNSVKIYGGFAGVSNTETVANRNWRTNVTVLEGNNAPVLIPANGVTLYSSTTAIDGLTVKGGKAPVGAGIYLLGGTVALTNIIFTDNVATDRGGAIWVADYTFPITNCIFQNNKAKYGAGIYNDEAYPTIKNCVFANDTASMDGGAVYSYISASNISTRKATIINSVFYGNVATGGGGGGIYNSLASPAITNCTFVANISLLNTGAAVYNQDDYNSASTIANPVITNCVFWNNRSSSLNSTTDIGSYRNRNGVQTYVTYSYFKENGTYTGTGNVPIDNISPLINVDNPRGSDNQWMTADDGLMPNLCGRLIDVGNNGAISETADIAQRPRKFDNLLINAVGQGTAPYVDLGAYEDNTTITEEQIAGRIGNAHTVPSPQELVPDYITSTAAPAAGTISWEQSTDGGITWAPAQPSGNQATYSIPALTQTTRYRRVVAATAYCNNKYYTAPVEIKVISPNGLISGKVVSRNNIAVKGIVIKVQRLTNGLSGTPDGYTYYDTTGTDGTFSVPNVYYGDYTVGSASASFRVTPVKANHTFDFAYLDKTLSSNATEQTNIIFTDRTVYAIIGRTYQQCTDCVGASSALPLQCPIDSVSIWTGVDGATPGFYSRTGFIDTAYGRYAVSITDPYPLRIEPRFTGHTFYPAFSDIQVSKDTAGVDFRDLTVHTIRGKLTDGCGKAIGRATLEFSDVLTDGSGNARGSCFRKQVATDPNSGYYEITLPARKYSVSIKSFTPADASQDLIASNVIGFFDTQVPKDSLTRNILLKDDTINLVYRRYPSITLVSGLSTLCKNGSNRDFALLQQGVTDSFRLRVLQGPASSGCPILDTTTKLKLFTNIPINDNATGVALQYNLVKDTITVRLKGGTPNIISPYYKTLNIQFTDRYGRIADAINRNVVVTGVKADSATFTTVSPQIPMLILHDPPGDQSFSTWQKDSTAQTAFRMYAGKGNSTEIWEQVKIGAKSEAGIGVTVESEVWGTVNGAVNITSNNTTSNETILTTTATQAFSTSNLPGITGADGDLYVGAALNLIYAGSTELTYNEANCRIDTTHRLLIANNGFATQYVYPEEFIRNTLIPNLQVLANGQSTPARRDSFQNQIQVWQQVMANNAANKTKASFEKNISFSGGGATIVNQTSSNVTAINTVEFNLNIDSKLAAELGFEVAGSGASGGITVAFKTEMGASTSTSLSKQTTIGYTLSDKDRGDYFSVDIKRDPVYSTPVFQLAAATASCPPEPGAQPRDEMQFNIPVPSISGIAENSSAQFTLKLGNTSQSRETRTYLLSLDQASNPNGAIVTIGGSPVITPVAYTIGYLGEVQVTVTVRKDASSSFFSYEGLRFTLTDACTGEVSKSATISANFASLASSATLAQPEANWVLNAGANNLLPVLIKDYNLARLDSITLEYSKVGTSNWDKAFTRTASQLATNGASGTLVNWNTMSLADTLYSLRLKVYYQQQIVYSQRVTGTIDRKGPQLFGRPQPTNDLYQNGTVISFMYNEPVSTGNLNSGQVTLRRLRDNTLVPVTVSGYDNQIIITPVNRIDGLVGDSFRVVVQNIADRYGNTKAAPDTSRFTVGTSIASTGPRALNVSIVNPVLSNTDPGTIDIYFTLPTTDTFDRRVYYTIAGTALLQSEYDTILPTTNRNVNSFNGAQGVIVIPKGDNRAILKIDPIFKNTPGADKTIKISLAEGGDYTLGSNTTVTGIITYAGILPLQLISFTGKPAGEAAALQWQTASEVNTASFTVEKSADGITFASFATVAAKGSGNNSYAATDMAPFAGKNFYRLKMADKDNHTTYSNVVVVTMPVKALQLISLSPSPLTDQAGKLSLVAARAAKLEIVIVDMAGRQIAVQTVTAIAGANTLTLSLPNLQAGIYTLYAMDGTTRSNVLRFVKQ